MPIWTYVSELWGYESECNQPRHSLASPFKNPAHYYWGSEKTKKKSKLHVMLVNAHPSRQR